MSDVILLSSQPKKPGHHRNGSDELDVFEAANYFSGTTENFSGTRGNISVEANTFNKYSMRPIRRMSLDMPNQRGDSNPLQSMLIENPTKEKKFKQPSSPGGKLAHFLNSLFNQASSKKSKSKKMSTKDEDESSPSGWKRKRRSSISYFTSRITTSSSTTSVGTAIVTRDDKSSFSTSTSSGFRTPSPYPYHVAHTPTKTTTCKDTVSYSYLKPPLSQITKIPDTKNLNKIENFNKKNSHSEKNKSFQNGVVEKVKILDEKLEDVKEFKKLTDDDDGADSDSSSDLFELANCDFGYCSSGLPVYKTTYMDSINRCAPISS